MSEKETRQCYRCRDEVYPGIKVHLNTGVGYACMTCYKKRERHLSEVR